jgi:integrase
MPRLTHKPPKYSLHKASGQAKVRHNGRTVYLGRYGTPESRDAYARFIAKLPKPGEAPRQPSQELRTELLVGEVALRFYEHAKGYYACNGVATGEHITIRCCLRPLTKRFGKLPASELGPKRVKEVREDMIRLRWSRRYINKAVAIVKRCFKWAAEEELVPGRVAQDIWAIKALEQHRSKAREKPEVSAVPDPHIDATMRSLPELEADIIRVMRLTGARPGEVLAMTADQIDRTDPSCWAYRPHRHKTAHKDKARVVFIGTRAQEIILRRMRKTARGESLFPTTRGALCHAVHLACKKAGVTRWSPNMVRHRVGTDIRATHGLEAAQCLLGHTRADVTQTYAERDQRLAAEIARKIG